MRTLDLIAQTAHWAVPYGRAAWDKFRRPDLWQLTVWPTRSGAGSLTVTVRPRHAEPVVIEIPGRRRSLTEAHVAALTDDTWRLLLDAAAHEARLERP